MKHFIVKIINIYQNVISSNDGILSKLGVKQKRVCVFYPTCSNYTKEAVIKYGSIKGIYLGFKRILRCNPWQKNHIDPL